MHKKHQNCQGLQIISIQLASPTPFATLSYYSTHKLPSHLPASLANMSFALLNLCQVPGSATSAALWTAPAPIGPGDTGPELPLLSGNLSEAEKHPILPTLCMCWRNVKKYGNNISKKKKKKRKENESRQIPTSSWSHAGNI